MANTITTRIPPRGKTIIEQSDDDDDEKEQTIIIKKNRASRIKIKWIVKK